MSQLTLDECLLLGSSEDDYYALWEASWIFQNQKERAERALRTLIEKELAAFVRMKNWSEQIIVQMTLEEQQQVLASLHEHEDWQPDKDTNKSIIWYYITPKGKDTLLNNDYVRATLKEYRAKQEREGKNPN